MNVCGAVVVSLMFVMSVQARHTIDQRVAEFGPGVAVRLKPVFKKRELAYPPVRLAFVGLKAERVLELYGAAADGKFRWLKSYPILAASGELGPKLREGDRQVPEGIYRIESLNPNSQFHLSLRVNYPNEFDRAQARRERRTHLGGDIMIHGGAASIGCVAIGDVAAEELFVLAGLAGVENVTVILSPVDFRKRELPVLSGTVPRWTDDLYRQIRAALQALRRTE